ncbi:MAG TPA: diguanylate cyclase, partial [Bryobacterales bacterium]|nr:diguanylate cyclase [Bryobacterales bacterium]
RREELKRIINLLTEHAMRLDTENKQFYLELRSAVQTFQDISQIEDITYMRKKLTERVTQLQETVQYQEASSGGVVAQLQQELEQAHKQIAVLSEGVTADSLTRLPSRQIAEKIIREQVETAEGFAVAMVVIDRLDMMNLRYGVSVGDEVVRHFAKELREKAPERIFLCRWSGPAFVGVETRALVPDVRAGLQKILAEIASQPMEVEAKRTGLIRVTSRFAVHQWVPGQSAEKIIKLVDIFCVGEKAEPGEKHPAEAAGS